MACNPHYVLLVHQSASLSRGHGPLFTTIWVRIPSLTCRFSKLFTRYHFRFYGGNLVYRGHFNATGEESGIALTVQGGFAFGYSAFLNGIFLGSSQGNATTSVTSDTWTIPNDTLRVAHDNVLTVIQGVHSSFGGLLPFDQEFSRSYGVCCFDLLCCVLLNLCNSPSGAES